MGNFYDEDNNAFEYEFFDLNQLGADFILQSVSNAQRMRSFHLNLVSKSDIWDSKNWFRNEVFRVIKDLTFDYPVLEDFEDAVLCEIKRLIKMERPRPGRVDGPWKGYATRKWIAPITTQATMTVVNEMRDRIANLSPSATSQSLSPNGNIH